MAAYGRETELSPDPGLSAWFGSVDSRMSSLDGRLSSPSRHAAYFLFPFQNLTKD
jgi:hypothetical protein